MPRQVCGVRGSPLIRFIILAIALAATAAGLLRVTAARTTISPTAPLPTAPKQELPGESVPFRLLLSAPAAMVEIDSGKPIQPPLDGSFLSGTLEHDPANPHVGVIVRWKTPASAGEHRFAKLTLEPPGQETLTHVFDAAGDIDDFLELPFPLAK
jgi:hypothetical protein